MDYTQGIIFLEVLINYKKSMLMTGRHLKSLRALKEKHKSKCMRSNNVKKKKTSYIR